MSKSLAGVQEGVSSELQIDVMRQLKAIYGDLLKGPSNISLPQLAGASTGQPEGQQQLTDSIRIMREKHVEYQVPAQHDLIKVCCIARKACPGIGGRSCDVGVRVQTEGQASVSWLYVHLILLPILSSLLRRMRLFRILVLYLQAAEVICAARHPVKSAGGAFRSSQSTACISLSFDLYSNLSLMKTAFLQVGNMKK